MPASWAFKAHDILMRGFEALDTGASILFLLILGVLGIEIER